MEEQLKILMEKLQSGIDKAPELYYGLRNEYFVNELLTYIRDVALGLGIVATILVLASLTLKPTEECNTNNPAHKREAELIRGTRKKFIIFVVCMVVIMSICIVLQYVLAPDILFLDKVRR